MVGKGWVLPLFELWGDLPTPLKYAVASAAGFSLLGGIVGLVVGLLANPMTSWFAVFELGIPAGVLGALLGFVAGSVVYCIRRFLRAD
jgi:hypothetical protein